MNIAKTVGPVVFTFSLHVPEINSFHLAPRRIKSDDSMKSYNFSNFVLRSAPSGSRWLRARLYFLPAL